MRVNIITKKISFSMNVYESYILIDFYLIKYDVQKSLDF